MLTLKPNDSFKLKANGFIGLRACSCWKKLSGLARKHLDKFQGRSQTPDFGGGRVDNNREKLKIVGLLNYSFRLYVNDQSKVFLKCGLFLPRTPPPVYRFIQI